MVVVVVVNFKSYSDERRSSIEEVTQPKATEEAEWHVAG
jgi:hypothetical protein